MRSVTAALAVSAIVIAVVIVAVLWQTPAIVLATNGVAIAGHIDLPAGNTSSCQQVGSVPRGTSAIRVSVGAGVGPAVRLRLISSGQVATHGELAAGWGLSATALVPVRPLAREVRNSLLCTALGPGSPPITVEGSRRAGTAGGLGFGDVDLRVEYLRAGAKSWWSMASSVAYRMGLGRAESGTWITYLALLLMVAVGVLAARLVFADLR